MLIIIIIIIIIILIHFIIFTIYFLFFVDYGFPNRPNFLAHFQGVHVIIFKIFMAKIVILKMKLSYSIYIMLH